MAVLACSPVLTVTNLFPLIPEGQGYCLELMSFRHPASSPLALVTELYVLFTVCF